MRVRTRLRKMTAAGIAAVIFIAPTGGSAQAGRLNMSYLYFGSTQSYINYVDQSQGALQTVSPSFFDLTDDGNLLLTDKADANFVKQMHDRGIKVVPFLSNHWDRPKGVASLQNRTALAGQIADAIKTYNLDGVNVDIENVTVADRDAYTDLVKQLRSLLSADKEVSVAVAANPDGWSEGWQGSYDYKELAKVSDYLMIMAYDETYEGVPSPGPVASLSYVEKSVQYALTQAPADKLVLGIPFYGRFWVSGNPAKSGIGISNTQVAQAIAQYGGTEHYDPKTESAWATFAIKASDTPMTVNYEQLVPGNYTVWYENDRSIQAKLQLVQKYGLKGAGSWSLHQETKDTWNYFSMWLNGYTFYDLIGHWAQNDVMAVADRKWMNGVSAVSFAPEAPLTRAQAAATLVRSMGLDGVKPADAAPFADVPSGYWGASAIAIAKQAGIIEGTGTGAFAPERPVSREEMAAMLSRILAPVTATASAGQTQAQAGRFTDMPASRWSYALVNAMAAQGVFDGFPDGTFRPGASMKRAEMAALMNRVADKLKQS